MSMIVTPAIIDRETFQKVQEEIARRSSLKKTSSKAKTQLGKYCGKYVLSELLVCGECGQPLPPGDLDAERSQTGRLAVSEPAGTWQEDLQAISYSG